MLKSLKRQTNEYPVAELFETVRHLLDETELFSTVLETMGLASGLVPINNLPYTASINHSIQVKTWPLCII